VPCKCHAQPAGRPMSWWPCRKLLDSSPRPSLGFVASAGSRVSRDCETASTSEKLRESADGHGGLSCVRNGLEQKSRWSLEREQDRASDTLIRGQQHPAPMECPATTALRVVKRPPWCVKLTTAQSSTYLSTASWIRLFGALVSRHLGSHATTPACSCMPACWRLLAGTCRATCGPNRPWAQPPLAGHYFWVDGHVLAHPHANSIAESPLQPFSCLRTG
jgi:hypothetical protein